MRSMSMQKVALLMFFILSFYANATEIRGIVKDADGNLLPGASIRIEASRLGAVVNANGEYTIKNVKNGNYFIVASFLGFKTEKRMVAVESQPVIADFVLSPISLKIGEVVVTANKHEENLQSVPIAITAITSEKIEDLNITQRTDLMATSPNTLIAESGSHMTDLINIRGMFPSNFFSTTSLFYFDGVPIFGYGQNPMALNDIERIEIIKGPQGTLYGRNALAGVINVVSKKPSNTPSYKLGAGYGNFSNLNVNAGISQPLIKDQLFARVSAYYYSKDGYFTNNDTSTGTSVKSNAGWSKGYGGTLNLRYYPVETFSAELFGNFEYINESVWPLADNPTAALKNPYEISRNINSFIKKNNMMGSLKLNYNLNFMNIVSTTAYQGITGLDWNYDADFSDSDLLSLKETTPYKNISEELRFENNKGNSPLKWMVGFFYMYERNDYDYAGTLGAKHPQVQQINAGINLFGMKINNLSQITKGPSSNTDLAAFGQATYTLFEKLDITAGLRYEQESMDINTVNSYDYTGTLPHPVPGLLQPVLGFLNAFDTLKRSDAFTFLSQKYSISYRLDESNMVYISASSGSHGGGYNSGNNKTVPYYKPENTWNYELGYKTTMFDNRLRINTDVFYIDWQNQQLLAIRDLSDPLQTIKNAGKTQIKGFEIGRAHV